jgi:group I intron endonuclease
MRKKRIPKFYYIYVITNKLTGRQYVGSRVCYEENPYDDNYMGSSEYLSKDILEYGIENFKKKILKDDYKNYGDLLDGETFYILEYKTLEPNGYNRFIPNKNIGFHMHGVKHSAESKEKIKQSLSGENNPNFGRKFSVEHKEKIRAAMKGKKNAKGIKWSDESRIKMSKIAKERSGDKNPMYGKKAWNNGLTKNTDERLKKMGEKIKIVKSKLK